MMEEQKVLLKCPCCGTVIGIRHTNSVLHAFLQSKQVGYQCPCCEYKIYVVRKNIISTVNYRWADDPAAYRQKNTAFPGGVS